MPKQYERGDNGDLYFHKSFYNSKVKNNYLSYLTGINKNKIEKKYENNQEENNNEITNKTIAVNYNQENLLQPQEANKAYQNSCIEESKQSRNKYKDNFNFEHKDSYKEKDLFRKTSSTAFKKVDNFGLEYFKVNAKTNKSIKINTDLIIYI